MGLQPVRSRPMWGQGLERDRGGLSALSPPPPLLLLFRFVICRERRRFGSRVLDDLVRKQRPLFARRATRTAPFAKLAELSNLSSPRRYHRLLNLRKNSVVSRAERGSLSRFSTGWSGFSIARA